MTNGLEVFWHIVYKLLIHKLQAKVTTNRISETLDSREVRDHADFFFKVGFSTKHPIHPDSKPGNPISKQDCFLLIH